MGNTHRSRQRVQKHCVEVSEFNYGNGILKIRIISWNIAENPEALHDSGYCQLFLNQDVIPDIYFIAFQERRSCRKEITKSIAVLLSSAHVHLRTDHRGSLTTCIFVKAEIYQTCSESAYFKYDLRQFTHRRTKSCLGITLTFGLGFKLTFINCHFQAGSKTLKSTLRRQRNMTNATKALLRRIRGSQVVFWCGDLNSRVKLRPREIKTFLNDKDIRLSAIAEHDELLNCINAGMLRNIRLMEGYIDFYPTFKYKYIDGEISDGSEPEDNELNRWLTWKRTPSYTDRILYKSKYRGHIECLEYCCAHQTRFSDHKPVHGLFHVLVNQL